MDTFENLFPLGVDVDLDFFPDTPEIQEKRYEKWKKYYDSRVSKLMELDENNNDKRSYPVSTGKSKSSGGGKNRNGENDKLRKENHVKKVNSSNVLQDRHSNDNKPTDTLATKSKPENPNEKLSAKCGSERSEKTENGFSKRATEKRQGPFPSTKRAHEGDNHRKEVPSNLPPHSSQNPEPFKVSRSGRILNEMLKNFEVAAGQAAIFADPTSVWETEEDLEKRVIEARGKVIDDIRKVYGKQVAPVDISVFSELASIQLCRVKAINNLRKRKRNLVNCMLEQCIEKIYRRFKLQWPDITLEEGVERAYEEDFPRNTEVLKSLGQEWEAFYLKAKMKPVGKLLEIAKTLKVYEKHMRRLLDRAVCTKDLKLEAFHVKAMDVVRNTLPEGAPAESDLFQDALFLQLSARIKLELQRENKMRIFHEIQMAGDAMLDVRRTFCKIMDMRCKKYGLGAVSKSHEKLARDLIKAFGGAPRFLYTSPWIAKREQLVKFLGYEFRIFKNYAENKRQDMDLIELEYYELFCSNVFLISDDPDWITRFRAPWSGIHYFLYTKCGHEHYKQFLVMVTLRILKDIGLGELNDDFDPDGFTNKIERIVEIMLDAADKIKFTVEPYKISTAKDKRTTKTPSESSATRQEHNVELTSNSWKDGFVIPAEHIANNMHLVPYVPEFKIPEIPMQREYPKSPFKIPEIPLERNFKIPKISLEGNFKIPEIPLERPSQIPMIPLEPKLLSGCHRLALEAQTRAKIQETRALLSATKTSDKIHTGNLESGTAIFFTANAIYVSLRAPRWSDQFTMPPEINLIQLPQSPTVLTTEDFYSGSVSLNVYDFLANPDAKFTKEVFMWQGEMVQLSAEEVIALFLHKLKTKILCNPGKDISSDVIAIALPTCISSACKQRLKSALHLVGLHQSVFVQATTAVGATHIMSRGNPIEARHFALVVYLESRFANTALLKVSAGKFKTIATGGFLYPSDETSTNPSVYPSPQQLLEKLITSIDEIFETAQVQKTDLAEYVCVVDDKDLCPSATPLHYKAFLTWLNNRVLEDLPDCAKRTLPINVGLVPGLFKISLRRSAPVQEPDFFHEVFPFRFDLLSVMDSNSITETSLVSKNMAAKDTVVNVPTHQLGTGTRPSYVSSYRYDRCCKEMQLFADDTLRQISSAVKIQVSGEGIVTTEIVHEWTGKKLPLELTPMASQMFSISSVCSILCSLHVPTM